MQSGNTLVSSQLHIPGVFSGSSSSRELCPVKGILSDRKKPPRSNKRVSFDENSLRKRKRTISLTSLKWQAYIEEQFRTLRAHRKRKSKRENGRNVFQKKPQPVPRSKNRSKKQESNGSAHLSDVNMFELPKTDGRRPEDPERYYMQNENSYTTNQREQAMTYEGGEHVGSVKVVKPKRPLNAFFVFAQYCRKKHLLDSMRSSNHAPRHGASVAPHVHGRALCIL
ncbi:uncharacterized protein LOC112565151 isoform X1 [Pomacea canaliculata]|uniref:uncharacterized protein LOC112565151 isoform X1 n=1 Tax=Pomacea canaliculata TaxID=400727 RepID=UPI000D73042C|nr:uncharacterized protein LOC112565151 isoform X1 [Pomacea canaliculata]